METAIWLTEVAPLSKTGKRFLDHLANVNHEANPEIVRLALKLATGAGKSTVMAMLIAWQTINAVRRPGSKHFTRGFLIVAPGITIKDRLRVLQPNDPDTRNQGLPIGDGGRNQQDAGRTQALAGIKALTTADFPLSLTTSHKAQVTVRGVDVFKPQTGEVVSDGADGIACWFLDTDYNEESFFVRHAYFLGQNDPCKSLKTTLKSEIDADAWSTLNSDTSRPFDKPKNGRIAVKVINHLGDEVMKVFRV